MRTTIILILSVFLMPFTAKAQQMKFGYLSYNEALRAMPDYAAARQNLATLKSQYEDETRRSEEEFNSQYEQFLDVQAELAAPIRNKRQAELQSRLKENVAFKKEAARLLRQARADMYAPLRRKLDAVLERIGRERGYAFILNTDGNALPYVCPTAGEDITTIVIDALRPVSADKVQTVTPAVTAPDGAPDDITDDEEEDTQMQDDTGAAGLQQ